ncbi:MAG: DUF6090 family protein [Eudoraea sp.]|uniref:DUF6090 family protein n=2 Tax=Eudoraea sp. TaxID=1979955 RepID=UPI003C78BE94
MIKFFRRIRQQLLKENNLSKYLLYAIGEIVLVVIGILIALQINNWNQENKESLVEKQRYQNILNDLVSDEANIDKMMVDLIQKQDLHYYLYQISQNNGKPDSTINVSRINSALELNLITGKNQLTELEFIKDLQIRREVNAYVKLENAALSDAERLEDNIKNKVRRYFQEINAVKIDKIYVPERYDNKSVKDPLDIDIISNHFEDSDFKNVLINLKMSTANTLNTLGALKEKNKILQTILSDKQ